MGFQISGQWVVSFVICWYCWRYHFTLSRKTTRKLSRSSSCECWVTGVTPSTRVCTASGCTASRYSSDPTLTWMWSFTEEIPCHSAPMQKHITSLLALTIKALSLCFALLYLSDWEFISIWNFPHLFFFPPTSVWLYSSMRHRQRAANPAWSELHWRTLSMFNLKQNGLRCILISML